MYWLCAFLLAHCLPRGVCMYTRTCDGYNNKESLTYEQRIFITHRSRKPKANCKSRPNKWLDLATLMLESSLARKFYDNTNRSSFFSSQQDHNKVQSNSTFLTFWIPEWPPTTTTQFESCSGDKWSLNARLGEAVVPKGEFWGPSKIWILWDWNVQCQILKNKLDDQCLNSKKKKVIFKGNIMSTFWTFLLFHSSYFFLGFLLFYTCDLRSSIFSSADTNLSASGHFFLHWERTI